MARRDFNQEERIDARPRTLLPQMLPIQDEYFGVDEERPSGGEGQPMPTEFGPLEPTPRGLRETGPGIYTAEGPGVASDVPQMLPRGPVRQPDTTAAPESVPTGLVSEPPGAEPQGAAPAAVSETPGIWDTIKRFGQGAYDFSRTEMGRNLLGSLAVGLAGVRNYRDNGALQNFLLQQHFTGIANRAAQQQQQEAMTGLMEAANEAQTMASAGNLEGAISALGRMSKNPMVMRNPVAVQHLLQAQAQLGERLTSKGAMSRLNAIKRGTPAYDEPEGGLPATPGREPDVSDVIAASNGNLDLASKLGGLYLKERKPLVTHWDDANQRMLVFDPNAPDQKGALTELPYGDGQPLPRQFSEKELPAGVRVALQNALANPDSPSGGMSVGQFELAYNGKMGKTAEEKQANAMKARQIMAGVLKSVTESAPEKSADERVAAAQVAQDEQNGVVKFKNETERKAAIANRVQANKEKVAQTQGYASSMGRQEAEKTKTIGAANRLYFDRSTMQAVPSSTLVGSAEADPKMVEVKAHEVQGITQANTAKELLQTAYRIVQKRRDLFPEKVTDVNLKTVASLMAPDTMGRLDPDLAKLRSLEAVIPTVAKLFGDTGNVGQIERQITAGALGLKPSSRASAEAALNSISNLLNQTLRTKGFSGFDLDELRRGDQAAPVSSSTGLPMRPPGQ